MILIAFWIKSSYLSKYIPILRVCEYQRYWQSIHRTSHFSGTLDTIPLAKYAEETL